MDTKQTREALKALREEIDTALGAVLANNPGMTLTLGRCSFTYDGGFTFKLEGSLKGGKTKEAVAYEQLAKALAIPEQTYMLNPKWRVKGEPFQINGPVKPGIKLPPLGTFFSFKGVRYEVTGAGRSKIYTRSLDGRTWTFKPEIVAKYAAIGEAA